MFDFAFDWIKELETGDELIDQQHKEFFRIGRDIEQLLVRKCIGVQEQELLDIVCELREYVSYHFYSEETIMRQKGYSNYELHVKEHLGFRKFIMEIDCPALAKNPYKELKALKSAIQSCVFNHMMGEDVRMIKEIQLKNN
ncbi:MAG TPA: hemerythrin [Lachnoclostridium phytofermentans]|uniref:Hemerythrin n=1 Tax=Lachnoclostridium phytofermentans TaxID=66219 RepID=A0A3D2X0Y3_9FIRM|nr:hemerythrin family protein [Lachnoclostridium sp.]HCL00810.1 hemerythrin [Lachnoclostridium phytofermentans]